MYDVMVKEDVNENGKQVVKTHRYHLHELNVHLRSFQKKGLFVLGVIPVFRSNKGGFSEKKLEEVRESDSTEYMDSIDPNCMIDGHGF